VSLESDAVVPQALAVNAAPSVRISNRFKVNLCKGNRQSVRAKDPPEDFGPPGLAGTPGVWGSG
jgi:hypothetical protein